MFCLPCLSIQIIFYYLPRSPSTLHAYFWRTCYSTSPKDSEGFTHSCHI